MRLAWLGLWFCLFGILKGHIINLEYASTYSCICEYVYMYVHTHTEATLQHMLKDNGAAKTHDIMNGRPILTT